MKTFSDYEILMVYLKECEDKQLEHEILSSPQACKQLAELERQMSFIENNLNHENLVDDYGLQLWNKIAPQLEASKPVNLWQKLSQVIISPSFSEVGIVAVFVASISFYFIGHNQALLEKDNGNSQLLAQNIQLHLVQTDIFLTQIKNMPEMSQSPMMITTAKQLASSNRIFKAASRNSDDKQISRLLTEIEQVLIEISNSSVDQPKNYLYDYNKELLFKVKNMNKQLQTNTTSI